MWKEFTVTKKMLEESKYWIPSDCAICKAVRKGLGKEYGEVLVDSNDVSVNGIDIKLPLDIDGKVQSMQNRDIPPKTFKFKLNIPKQLL